MMTDNHFSDGEREREHELERTQPTSPYDGVLDETQRVDAVPPRERVSAHDAPTTATPRVRSDESRVPPPERPGYRAPQPPQPPAPPDATPSSTAAGDGGPAWGSLLIKIGFGVVASIVVAFFIAVAAGAVGYVAIASRLPSPTELQEHQTAFVSSKIYDRNGQLLYEVTDPQGGRRTYVSLDEISPNLINATIATEDRDFWLHPGFDPIAVARAVYYALTEREFVSGASTISQQLARMVFLPEERFEPTAERKIKEIVLASELTRTYPKETVLEIYLNELNYGNLAYGIQAASETYFGVGADELTLAQASFLAGLPQLPAAYDPFGGGLERALDRQEDVLALMVEDGHITEEQAEQAAAAMRNYPFQAPQLDLSTAPHFVVYARRKVEELYGPEALYRGAGLRIYTTLDLDLQRRAEQAVREHIAELRDRNATNAALVALDPTTGQIRALVGSADYDDETIDGQVNVALRCRQPGSSIKPLTYVAAFERGWTPATLLWDVRTEFPDGANPPYVPLNYDREFHGPMLVRDALANSYNVPAVETLQFVGVDGLLEFAQRLGVDSLVHPEDHCPDYPYDEPPAYGLALTLGGGEVRLLEMTGAFGVFANQGVRTEPTPILRIEDSQGNVLIDNSEPGGERVISREHAYLITDILADPEARCDTFRCPGVLDLSRPAAVKTGTTNDYRDAWTIGYTPDLVTGVWVGNSDNSEMDRVPGSAGAGPIWHNFMEAAHAETPVHDFERPPGIVEHEICADSGARPTQHCPRRKTEIFAEGQPPRDESHDWYQMVRIDAFSGLRANEHCPDHVVEKLMLDIEDKRGRAWVQAHPEQFGGLPLAPLAYCTESSSAPQVFITQPAAGERVQGKVRVIGTVQMPNFDHYEAQYGAGNDPGAWQWISGPHLSPVREGVLIEWDTTHLSPGPYTLRIRAYNRNQDPVETRVTVQVAPPE
jgi:1A family penicillin-binding protein